MKIPALISLKDNTFELYGEIKNAEKYYIDEELGLVNATIEIHDPRTLSPDQRKKWFALIRDISLYTGYPVDYLHTLFKTWYCLLNEKDWVSMADVDMETASEMIDFVLKWAFEFGVPLAEDTGDLFRGEERWTYYCLKNRICVICGKKADIHHVEAIGMGRDRRTIDDSKLPKLPLCRTHHTESHTIGQETFLEKYHVKPIVYNE